MKAAVRKRKPAPAEDYTLPFVLRTRPALDLTEDQFFALCQLNRDLRIERNAEGDLEIMAPAGWETSDRNAEITMQLRLWAKREGNGVATDSSGGYRLPNSAVRGPDAAWILRSRLQEIPAAERAKFLPLCPDFVLELRSPTDRLAVVQAKMEEYLANGARLGWLLDPEQRRVYVYRPDAPVARLDRPETVAGDPVLPGFVLDLREIW
jgi:Uma2 family endonuclease